MSEPKFVPNTVYVTYIASTPEKVWEALTSAEFSRRYFSGFAVEMERRLGGSFIVRAPDGSEHISGEVFEYDPPNKLTVTWNVNWPDPCKSRLRSAAASSEARAASNSAKLFANASIAA